MFPVARLVLWSYPFRSPDRCRHVGFPGNLFTTVGLLVKEPDAKEKVAGGGAAGGVEGSDESGMGDGAAGRGAMGRGGS